jgi:hypothetical protein
MSLAFEVFGEKSRLESLLEHFSRIEDPREPWRVAHPLAFAGKKARRLLVYADANVRPPWGGWCYLSHLQSERLTFTRFRAAINKAIAPHEIDHVHFTTDRKGQPGAP